MSFSEWLDEQYDLWFEVGAAGGEYRGRTFYGYYGWLDGHEQWVLKRRQKC